MVPVAERRKVKRTALIGMAFIPKRRKRSAVGFLIFSGNAGRQSALNARDVANADCFAKNIAPIIREIQSSGVASHRGIARALNARGVATARGGRAAGSRLSRTPHPASVFIPLHTFLLAFRS
jgi:hypothetical protein